MSTAAGDNFDWTGRRVLVTGGHGFLGAAVGRTLAARGVTRGNLALPQKWEFDLRDAHAVQRLYEVSRPDVVIHCAGYVGGLQRNRDEPGRMFHDNMGMALQVIEGWRAWCARWPRARAGGTLVQIGSMTSYPAGAEAPFREEALWMGYPEAASAAYGIAKLAAWTMLDAYHRQYGTPSAYLIPVNLYGPGDNIDDEKSAHVAGSLVKRFADAVRAGAAEVTCWGTGAPTRQFLYVDDAAEAIVRAAELVREPRPINIAPPLDGPGGRSEISIRELAELIARLSGFPGRTSWDASKPDGQSRRCLDASRAEVTLGWRAQVSLEEGLKRTVEWYRARWAGRRREDPPAPGR